MSENVTRKVLISGRVQGVGFRMFTRDKAEKHGVKGYVRNLNDGRVEAMLQADEASVEAMLDEVRKGPAFAKVEGIDTTTPGSPVDYQEFSITR